MLSMKNSINCDSGSYSNNSASTVCRSCETGRYSTKISNELNIGPSICYECEIGYYAPTTGLLACIPCEAGRYSSVNGSNSCVSCSGGTRSEFASGSSTW
jgi:hypothetical protein